MKETIKRTFLEQYQALHPTFVRYCGSRAYGLLETEDLVQETILIALESYEKLKNKERLLAYLIGIANNLSKRYARRRKFRGDWEEAMIEKLESHLGNAELAMEIHDLHQAIQYLSETQRESILLFYISGLSVKEIATVQQVSESAVKTRLSRARVALRKLLSDEPQPAALNKKLLTYASLF